MCEPNSVNHVPSIGPGENQRTLPGSIISTIAASLPSKGPERMVTIRPTSTSFHPAGLISTLDILPTIGDCVEESVGVFEDFRSERIVGGAPTSID